MNPGKVKGGFTLLELIIALAIIVIATSGVFLAFRQPERRALENASRQLQADIRYIQRRAIAEGRQFAIFLEPGENGYRITYYNPRVEIRAVNFQNNVRLHYPSTPDRLGFLPRGTPSRSRTIELRTTRYSQRLTIVVSGGRVYIRDITRLIN